jgi:TetR/AcrR family transcriptional repressor of mexJK operon
MEHSLSRDKEELILQAARRRFAAYSYSKVTMDEIAEDIGMAKASLYYYFPTKEAIFRSVVQHEQEEFLARAKEVFAHNGSADNKMIEYVQLRLKLTERLSNLSQIHQQAWHEVKPIFNELFKTFVQHELHYVTQILQEGRKSGEFRLEEPKKIASMILHVLQGLHLRFFRGYDQQAIDESDHELFEHETLLFVNTILYGICKKSKH